MMMMVMMDLAFAWVTYHLAFANYDICNEWRFNVPADDGCVLPVLCLSNLRGMMIMQQQQ